MDEFIPPTFEEYRKEQIDFIQAYGGEVSIERIKDNYDNMIESLKDDDYLQPISESIGIPGYLRTLERVFNIDSIKPGEVMVISAPSFDVERQLTLTKNGIFLEKCHQRIWEQMYTHKALNLRKTRNKILLKSHELDGLLKECIELMKDIRPRKGRAIILDGVYYYFYLKHEEGIRKAMKHSPRNGTRTGNLISRLESL